MRLLILMLAIALLFAAQDAYAAGNALGSGALLIFAVLVVWVCGYCTGYDAGGGALKPTASLPEEKPDGSA